MIQVSLLSGGIRTLKKYFPSDCPGQLRVGSRHFAKLQGNPDEELNELFLLKREIKDSSLSGSVTSSCPLCPSQLVLSWLVISGVVTVAESTPIPMVD